MSAVRKTRNQQKGGELSAGNQLHNLCGGPLSFSQSLGEFERKHRRLPAGSEPAKRLKFDPDQVHQTSPYGLLLHATENRRHGAVCRFLNCRRKRPVARSAHKKRDLLKWIGELHFSDELIHQLRVLPKIK